VAVTAAAQYRHPGIFAAQVRRANGNIATHKPKNPNFSKEPMREKRRNEEPGSGANRNLKDEQQHFLIAFSPVPSWRFRQC